MALALVLNRRRQVPAEDSPAFGAIAERFRRAGELERAVALCQEGLQKYPKHLSSRVTLGWALLDLGRYDEARVELEQVLKRAPDNLAAIRGLAQLHDRTEHDDVASMQAGPSRWSMPEPTPDPPESEVFATAAPGLPAQAVELDATAGPWIGLEVPPPPVFDAPTPADHVPAMFFDDASDVDALAAELLGPSPAVGRIAVAVLEDDERPWCDDGLELGAPEPIQPAHALLELVPADRAAELDNEFIPDDGPGPWPPVFQEDEAAAPGREPLRLASWNAERDAWPPVELRPAVKCAPAVEAFAEGSHFSTTLTKPRRAGLLSALGKFRRRVDSRRRAVVSESVAG